MPTRPCGSTGTRTGTLRNEAGHLRASGLQATGVPAAEFVDDAAPQRVLRPGYSLLARERFRTSVFARSGGRCVVCGEAAVDAHHLLERRLFPDGGYYLANGVALCAVHHLAAEQTSLSPDELRRRAGIDDIVLPPHLDPGETYDKWGNVEHADGTRAPGELFYEEPVQALLAASGALERFVRWSKYPRTPHLPWSPGASADDVHLADLGMLAAADEVVVTEKMDGENTSLWRDRFHARSVDSAAHPSRHRAQALWAQIAHDIPPGWRISAENLYAVHSISYAALPGYLLVFGVWDERDRLLSWDETTEWAALLGLPTVPLLYRGPYDEEAVRSCWAPALAEEREGYVVRVGADVARRDFGRSVAKFVRPHHVAADAPHWRARDDFAVNGLAAP